MNWRLEAGWWVNDAGVGIRFGGRYTLDYRHGERCMQIPCEMGDTSRGGVRYFVWLHNKMRWMKPHECETLTAEKVAEIQQNILDAVHSRPRSLNAPPAEVEVDLRILAREHS